MEWQQALDETISSWERIRDGIGDADELQLLSDINAVCDLCRMSDDEAHESGGRRCDHCLVFQQWGGCLGINALMSEKVVEKDWDELRHLVDRFITELRTTATPPSTAGA
jgi:hypothetical protein